MPYSVLYCVIYLFILSLKAISLIGGKYLLKHKLKIERLYWPLDFCLVSRHLRQSSLFAYPSLSGEYAPSFVLRYTFV